MATRDLNKDEMRLFRRLEEQEATMGSLLNTIENQMSEHGDREAGRWLSLARTHLETGFIFANKAITRPVNGLGRRQPK